MRAFSILPGEPLPADDLRQIVITEDVTAGEHRIRKGHRLSDADAGFLVAIDRPVHAVVLEPGDVHEDDAAARLARAVAGPNLEIRGPKFSRYNLIAETKGVVHVAADALLAVNRLPGMAIFTLADRTTVVPGKIVAGVKVTPVAVDEATLREAERIAAAAAPMIRLEAFRPLRVGVINTERPDWRVRDKFESAVRQKIGWYGGSVTEFSDVPPEVEAIAGEIARLADEGADLVLAAGGSTIDPLDPTLLALPKAGAELTRHGAPADPGSMFWLAYRGDVPIFNLASCSMFSKTTVADVVLPWIMTGERVVPETMAALGHGGLLDRDMTHRFPPYNQERNTEADAD